MRLIRWTPNFIGADLPRPREEPKVESLFLPSTESSETCWACLALGGPPKLRLTDDDDEGFNGFAEVEGGGAAMAAQGSSSKFPSS